MSQAAKQLMALVVILAACFLLYMDRTHWHSFVSYRHEDPMTQCHVDGRPVSDEVTGIVTSHFKCLEGEVTLSLNFREIAP